MPHHHRAHGEEERLGVGPRLFPNLVQRRRPNLVQNRTVRYNMQQLEAMLEHPFAELIIKTPSWGGGGGISPCSSLSQPVNL